MGGWSWRVSKVFVERLQHFDEFVLDPVEHFDRDLGAGLGGDQKSLMLTTSRNESRAALSACPWSLMTAPYQGRLEV
jgi:hypothetical protein